MFARTQEFFGQFDRRLWVLVTGWFVAALGFAASIPFISIYFHGDLGLSPLQIGLFFAAQAVVRSVFQAVGGEMSDRIGRRGLLIHSQTVRSLSFLLLGVAIGFKWGFWPIALLFTANSIFGSIFMPAVNALVSDILPGEKRLYGYAVARSASNLGWAVGPAIGGFLAKSSYASLFYLSAALTLGSAMIFRFFLKVPPLPSAPTDKFKMSDLLAVKDDKFLAINIGLTFILYLVVAQLIAPFSIYAVEMVHISESQLGFLFTLNGLMVALLQIPITRLFAHRTFTFQLSLGALLYFIGYGSMGVFAGFNYFIIALIIVTVGEVTMSPPGLTLVSRMAPPGRIGRYLGIRGFAETAGWSLGPLYGGLFLDHFGGQPSLAWVLIASLALVAAVGFGIYGKYLPREFNVREK